MSDVRHHRDGWLVTLIGLAVRLAVVAWAWTRIPPTADGNFYHVVAQRIAAGEGYTWLWPDGAVTYAAHYPVGYPALIALPYALFGPHPGVAMVMNALLGALACWAAHRLLASSGRRVALLGGLLVALHPGLVAYTPALMTEGVTAALWIAAAWLAHSAAQSERRRRWLRLLGCGLVVGVATLVRPQSVLLAPVLGFASASSWRARGIAMALVASVAVLTCAPWTIRNCQRMGTCAFVSVNGGWNLLIGTQPEGNGAWSPLRVPEPCKSVFDEAEKDTCFGAAARERIRAAPGAWLALLPAKLNVTFDYCGAGPWYLHEANGTAFPYGYKQVVGTLETAYERLVLLLALLGAWTLERRQHWLRTVALAVGLAFIVQRHATLTYLALAMLLWWRPDRRVLDVAVVGAIASSAFIHAIFFGAGRYQLVLWPLLCAVAAARSGYFARQMRALFPSSPMATRTKR